MILFPPLVSPPCLHTLSSHVQRNHSHHPCIVVMLWKLNYWNLFINLIGAMPLLYNWCCRCRHCRCCLFWGAVTHAYIHLYGTMNKKKEHNFVCCCSWYIFTSFFSLIFFLIWFFFDVFFWVNFIVFFGWLIYSRKGGMGWEGSCLVG